MDERSVPTVAALHALFSRRCSWWWNRSARGMSADPTNSTGRVMMKNSRVPGRASRPFSKSRERTHLTYDLSPRTWTRELCAVPGVPNVAVLGVLRESRNSTRVGQRDTEIRGTTSRGRHRKQQGVVKLTLSMRHPRMTWKGYLANAA